MSKIISVTGATGTQGGSVVRILLKSKNYHIRAITRNTQSNKAKALAMLGAEVVQADVDDYASLEKAFAGSHAIFAMTNFFEPFPKYGPEKAVQIEAQQGINLAKAAAATSTLEHYIWSTLPNTRKISGGKLIVPHFEGKNIVDDYIKSNKTLASKTTFLWLGLFAQVNVSGSWAPIPVPTAAPGTYVQIRGTPASVPYKSMGDADVNVGLFVESILSQPQKTRGRFVSAYVESLTAGELLDAWAKTQGKKAYILQVPKKEYFELWAPYAEEYDLNMEFFLQYGEKSWSGEDFLTKDDLNITGLVSTAEAFAGLKPLD